MHRDNVERMTAAAVRLVRSYERLHPHDWPCPRAVKGGLPLAPDLDADVLLPRVLREFVQDEAGRMPCIPDFVAATLICTLGAVVGTQCVIKPKRFDTWVIAPNLFGGVVGEPSSKKTPGMNAALRHLDDLEAKEAKRYDKALRLYESEEAAYAARQTAAASKLKGAASSTDSLGAMASAVAAKEGLEPPQKPKRRRFKTNDATVAKIGDILVDSPAGLMVFRDELMALLASWDKPGNEADRAFYLEGFNGTGSFNTDRIGRGSLRIETFCLSVFGGIQPELLERYLAKLVNSLDNDGRIQRFQVLVYPEPIRWKWCDREPVEGAREAVRDVFERLASFDPVRYGAEPASDFIKFPHFHFDDTAQEIFIQWSKDLHTDRIEHEKNPLIRQHLAKYEKLFCSLALILHLVEDRTGPVQEDTAMRAAAWCSYLEGHARRIYALAEVGKVNAAERLSRRLLDKKLSDGFTVRDVVRKGWTGLESSAIVETALAVLEAHDWVRKSDTLEGLGRPTVRFEINPLIYEGHSQ